jgi:ABC-type uncharacterized transport system permease subunit
MKFVVLSKAGSPVLKPISLTLDFDVRVEAEVEDASTVVKVDGRTMVAASDDPKRRTLDLRLQAQNSKRVTVEEVRDGRTLQSWTQEVNAGRANSLKP